MVEDSGIEPLTEACKATVFPIIPIPQILGDQGGNRTPTNGFGDRRTAIILHRNLNLRNFYTIQNFSSSSINAIKASSVDKTS